MAFRISSGADVASLFPASGNAVAGRIYPYNTTLLKFGDNYFLGTSTKYYRFMVLAGDPTLAELRYSQNTNCNCLVDCNCNCSDGVG